MLISIAAVSASPAHAVETRKPVLHGSPSVATAGFFSLYWRGTPGPFVLQESGEPDFTRPEAIYRGRDRARVMSGREDGKYYFRVRAAHQRGWSEPVAITVHHHPLPRALGFLTAGLVVFAVTAGTIIAGAARTRDT